MTLATWLPAISCWAVIHPLVKIWRKVGPRAMWWVVGPMIVLQMALLAYFRDPLLGPNLGTSFWVLIPAAILIVIGFYLDYERRQTLTTRILVGTPEIENDASNLLTTGPYARVRHPRYLAILFSYGGVAVFSNFLGLYIYMALSLPMLWFIMLLEEKELIERFGKAYMDYAAKTPRIFPNLF